jgi:hypothetical protein
MSLLKESFAKVSVLTDLFPRLLFDQLGLSQLFVKTINNDFSQAETKQDNADLLAGKL